MTGTVTTVTRAANRPASVAFVTHSSRGGLGGPELALSVHDPAGSKEVVMSSWNLSAWVAAVTAVVIAAVMAVFAAYEYFATPGASAADLLIRHGWHVLIIGVVVYAVLWLTLRRLVLRPIRIVGAHLYGVGTGVVEPLDLDTGVTEIEALVSSVNLMIQRMRQGHDGEALDTVQEDLFALRQLARDVHPVDPQRSSRILAHVTRLQAATASMIRRAA